MLDLQYVDVGHDNHFRIAFQPPYRIRQLIKSQGNRVFQQSVAIHIRVLPKGVWEA